MSVDIEKVSKLVGLVDKLIQIKGIENSLDESAVMNLIRSGLDFSGASYSDEEIEAVKRDITWKYQIFTMPGQSILADYTSYFGDIVETPYLTFDPDVQIENFRATEKMVTALIAHGYAFDRTLAGRNHYIIQAVPKAIIVDYIRKLRISRYSSDFDPRQIAEFLENTADKSIEHFDVVFMEGNETDDPRLVTDIAGRKIPKVLRRNCIIDSDTKRLGIGRRGKLGGPGDGRAGIVDFEGMAGETIIEEAKRLFREEYKRRKKVEFAEGKTTYPSKTWFAFVEKRRPLLLIYLMDIDVDKDETNQKIQVDKFRAQLGGIPVVGLALGLPRNNDAAVNNATKYKANKVYNWFERDSILAEAEEED